VDVTTAWNGFQKLSPPMFDIDYWPVLAHEDNAGREHMHLVDDFARCFEVTLDAEERQPRIPVPVDVIERGRARLAAKNVTGELLIAVQTGPSWAVREWLPAEWDKLATELQREYGATVIQLGADANTTGKGAIRAHRVKGAIDLVDDRPIEETIGILKLSDYFIGIDSGLLHLAGAVGTPSLGIFGAVNPHFRLPPITPSVGVTAEVECLGCHHQNPTAHWKTGCHFDVRCMQGLTSARVFSAFQELVAKAEAEAVGPAVVQA
jgi:ADP-heptose:LPS heptosyltransferase